MSTTDSQPNILVIMTDQHNRAFSGCYGNKLVRTPTIDRLAAEGKRFDNAYCASPLCTPSRMSFMTSRTPSHNRVWTNNHTLSSAIPTWAHGLGIAGYETALIGRMHFVGSDQRHGFERRPLGEYMAVHPGVPWAGGDPWTAFSLHVTGQNREAVETAGTGTTSYQTFDDDVAAATCAYLAEERDHPFAAVAGFMLPHCPFIAPAELFDYYYERVELPNVPDKLPACITRFQEIRGIAEPLNDERIRVAIAAYYALCEYVDSRIGEILDSLEANGLAENTLVIYTSDHGEMAGSHGCWWKSTFYEGSAGVPLIMRQPGVVPAGTTSNAICNLLDIGPTLVEVGGGEPLPACDGRSLVPVMQGDEASWVNETYSEQVDIRCGDARPLPSRMIRRGRWKYWEHVDDAHFPPTLFDLEADPTECNDLGEHPDYAEIRSELAKALHSDWDPHWAVAETERISMDYTTIANWGQTTRPVCHDTLPAPDPPVETDIELR